MGGGALSPAVDIATSGFISFPAGGNPELLGVCFDNSNHALVILPTDSNQLTALLFNVTSNTFTKTNTITNDSITNLTSAPVIKYSPATNNFLIMYSGDGNSDADSTTPMPIKALILSITADTSGSEISLSSQTIPLASPYLFNSIPYLSFDFDTTGNATAAWAAANPITFNNTIFYSYQPAGGLFGEVFTYSPASNAASLFTAFSAFSNIKFMKGVSTTTTATSNMTVSRFNIFSTGESGNRSWCITVGPLNQENYGLFLNTIPNKHLIVSALTSSAGTGATEFNKTNSNQLFSVIEMAATGPDGDQLNTQFYNFSTNTLSPLLPIISLFRPRLSPANVFNNTAFVAISYTDSNGLYTPTNIYSGYTSPSSSFSTFPTITDAAGISQTAINPISATGAFVFYVTEDLRLMTQQF